MFIQIEDPSDLPRPPEEVCIRAIDVDPYPDRQRLRVLIELTPFVEPPDMYVRVVDEEGIELADLNIVGAHQTSLSLTVHLRRHTTHTRCTIEASVLYEDLGQVSQSIQEFALNKERADGQA